MESELRPSGRLIKSTTVGQFLRDIAEGNPPPEEQWRHRDDFDPMHGIREIRSAAKAGLIDLDETEGDPAMTRFRFTAKGRARLQRSTRDE